MKRTCLQKNTTCPDLSGIEDQRKLNTDEQNTCGFPLSEISVKERHFDPKGTQQVKGFVRMKQKYSFSRSKSIMLFSSNMAFNHLFRKLNCVRMKNIFILFFSFVSMILISCNNEEQISTLDIEIERLSKSFTVYGRTTGIAIGIIKDGQKKIYLDGFANTENDKPLTEHTILEIGSVTKTFTALLFAQLHLEGRLNMNDYANAYLTADLQLPDKDGVKIKIIHLLNHTSGLAREPDDISSDHPYCYSESELSAYLKRITLDSIPGAKQKYSNTGFAIAGLMLENITDSTYTELLETRIFKKLGMVNTLSELDENQEENFAQGYFGSEKRDYLQWSNAFMGAGVIKSTINDLLIYMEHFIDAEASVLRAPIELTMDSTFSIDSDDFVGLSWFLWNNPDNNRIVFHAGGQNGYSSIVSFNVTNQTGAIVMMNTYSLEL